MNRKQISIYSGKPSYKRVLFVYNDGISFFKPCYWVNWHCKKNRNHWRILMPFFRFVKCNTHLEIGLGNYYIVWGW